MRAKKNLLTDYRSVNVIKVTNYKQSRGFKKFFEL